MQHLIARYKKAIEGEGESYIPALDGVRALMVLLVVSFHIWQQSWLTPVIALGGIHYSADYILRSGYLWVDGMLLLSGFLLYLPFAYAKEKGGPSPQVGHFYLGRIARIVPSYLLSILVMLLAVALPRQAYSNTGDMAKDLLAHLSFTHNLFRQTYYATPLNGALWTLAVEMQFYLVFPLLGRAFRRQPVITYVSMTGVAFLFRGYAAQLPDTGMWFNQMPAFLDVYANGFVAASVFVSLKKRMKEDKWTRILLSVCAAAAALIILDMCWKQSMESGQQQIRLGQMRRRYPLSVFIALLMVGVSLGLGGIRVMLGNRITRVLSQISYQMYIWHQVLAVQLRRWGVPPSNSATPNVDQERTWQVRYVIICYAGALIISCLVTYLFERPIVRRFRKLK